METASSQSVADLFWKGKGEPQKYDLETENGAKGENPILNAVENTERKFE